MDKNVGAIDKIIRYVVAVVMIILGYKVHWGFYILAGVAIITTIMGYCPVYSLCKINTKK